MRKFLFIAASLAVMCGVAEVWRGTAQDNVADDDWVSVDACNISLMLPPDLKRTNREGIDSCIVEFENRKMTFSIDYGWYGGFHKKSNIDLEFKEQSTTVDGKPARLATYVDDSLYARKNPDRKYVAHLYVVIKPAEGKRAPMTSSLVMTARGESEKEQEIAERIFRSVRFQ